MGYKAGSVVIVPFPFTDKHTTKKRPAVVINTAGYQEQTHHVLLMMITSAKQSAWAFDTPLMDLASAGLPQPCIIRQKWFTLDEQLIIREEGHLSSADWEVLMHQTHQVVSPCPYK